MIVLIGTSKHISESIADLLSHHSQLHFLEVSSRPKISGLNILLPKAKMIIINLYGIYEEGVNLIRQIRKINVDVPIIALDSHESPTLSNHLLNNGANAYFSIPSSGEELNKLIQGSIK